MAKAPMPNGLGLCLGAASSMRGGSVLPLKCARLHPHYPHHTSTIGARAVGGREGGGGGGKLAYTCNKTSHPNFRIIQVANFSISPAHRSPLPKPVPASKARSTTSASAVAAATATATKTVASTSTPTSTLTPPRHRRPPPPSPTNSRIQDGPSAPLTPSSSGNPPTSTLPPPLHIPEKPVGDGEFSSPSLFSRLKYYYDIGRAYVSFYRKGLTNVKDNFVAARLVHKRLGISIFASPLRALNVINQEAAARANPFECKISCLTRGDFQLMWRTRQDLKRVIPFVATLLVCGEFTPLLVMAGWIKTPRTCVLPKQSEKELQAHIAAKLEAEMIMEHAKFGNVAGEVGSRESSKLNEESMFRAIRARRTFIENMSKADSVDVYAACLKFGLKVKTPRFLTPIFGEHYHPLMRRRLRNHLLYLLVDDLLILMNRDSWQGLSVEELRIALRERGAPGLGIGLPPGVEEAKMTRWLTTWIVESFRLEAIKNK